MTIRTPFRRLAIALSAGALLMAAAVPASAQSNWPARPIKLIIPFAAGGGTDILGRTIAQKLGEALGQSMYVDNRPGAGGSVGTAEVARAPADGYTLLMGSSSTHGINPTIYSKLPYDPIKDFAPVSQLTINPFVMAVPSSLPVKTLQEFVKLTKDQPNTYNYASSGNGTTSHLAAALFVHQSGANLRHIPYKSNVPGLNDLLGGRVSVMFDNITAMQAHIQSGALRPLATTGLMRSSLLRDVPTVDESGVPGYEIVGWTVMLAPAGTPPEIVSRLNSELGRVMALPEVREKLASQGAEARTGSSEELARLIATEIPKWKTLIELAGAKVD